MKVVSDKFKEVMNQVVRPTSQFQASLEMFDRSVSRDATVISSETMPYSTGVFDVAHEGDYATFERDFLEVGSKLRICPDNGYIKNGYVSSVACDENGVFQQIPIIEFTFTQPRQFIAMTYEFSLDYPTEIRVTYFLNGEEQGQFRSFPTGVNFVDSDNHIYECDRVTFEFLKLSEPHHRLRISKMVFGYEKIFNMDSVISVDHTLSVDPISSSLSQENLKLSVNNLDKDYNPDNPQGIWTYFTNGLPFSIRYGIRTDDAVEWVEAGRLVLSDAPTVDGTSASFEAIDVLSSLTDNYNKGVWNADGTNLYDLAVDVLEDAGVTDYILPDSLKNIVTMSPMPILPHKECLQIIANASECVLYTNAQGYIVIEKQIHDATPVDYHLDFEKMFEKPIVKKSELLKSVDVSVHSLKVSSEETEICKQEKVTVEDEKEIQIMYDCATDVKAYVIGGFLKSANYYAHTAFLKISATSDVTIIAKGYAITDDTSVVSTKVNDQGEVCPVDNPLITDTARAERVGKWVGEYLKSRNSYDMDVRQDFILDVNDVIRVRSNFEDDIPARVTKLQFKLPGQQGAVSLRRVK